MYEGRELYLANLDWHASEKDVKQAFKKYGYVESVRILKKINGSSKGMGFVVFRDKEAATAALEMNLTDFRNRTLNVSVSTDNKSARPTLVTSDATSQRGSGSPAPNHPTATESNGNNIINDNNAASPISNASITSRDKDNSAQRAEIQSRTLALLNIPDTINDGRIRSLCAPYGDLVRVQLRPLHGGAVIEYKDVNSVGKASLGLQGHEIAPGRHLSIGSVAALNRAKGEFRSDRLSERSKNTNTIPNTSASTSTSANANSLLQQSGMPIRRPRQPDASRRGGRGGLGATKRTHVLPPPPPSLKPGDAAAAAGDADPKSGNVSNDGMKVDTGPADGEHEKQAAALPPKRSNAEFREMLLKKK